MTQRHQNGSRHRHRSGPAEQNDPANCRGTATVRAPRTHQCNAHAILSLFLYFPRPFSEICPDLRSVAHRRDRRPVYERSR